MTERRRKAYAARYDGGEIAVATIRSTISAAWSAVGSAPGWELVPIEIVWDDGEVENG